MNSYITLYNYLKEGERESDPDLEKLYDVCVCIEYSAKIKFLFLLNSPHTEFNPSIFLSCSLFLRECKIMFLCA